MHVELAIPFADSRASDLAWGFSVARLPCLARLDLVVPGGTLELRVLGSSHQVLVHTTDGERCSEVVACGLASSPGLPAGRERTVGGRVYRFRSGVVQLAPEPFAAEVRALVGRFRADLDALVAAFPGDGTAVTVVAAEPGRCAWRTWHAYPGTGELVSTWSELAGR